MISVGGDDVRYRQWYCTLAYAPTVVRLSRHIPWITGIPHLTPHTTGVSNTSHSAHWYNKTPTTKAAKGIYAGQEISKEPSPAIEMSKVNEQFQQRYDHKSSRKQPVVGRLSFNSVICSMTLQLDSTLLSHVQKLSYVSSMGNCRLGVEIPPKYTTWSRLEVQHYWLKPRYPSNLESHISAKSTCWEEILKEPSQQRSCVN